MPSVRNQTMEWSNKRFEEFTIFIAFTLIFRLVPIFEGFTDNFLLQVIISLIIISLIQILFTKSKLSIRLRNICERLKIKIAYLYIVYILFYFIVLPIIFPSIYA
ncbi:hypothetical protein [Paucisalibacillus globulus]|uniref:hypothetical protein n=1 Tax=Paucisalibacillus globulus TaxID=351095 RepID=UPI000BB8DB9E|nr:hypothetical protein [Paucisalibacillus globulus]